MSDYKKKPARVDRLTPAERAILAEAPDATAGAAALGFHLRFVVRGVLVVTVHTRNPRRASELQLCECGFWRPAEGLLVAGHGDRFACRGVAEVLAVLAKSPGLFRRPGSRPTKPTRGAKGAVRNLVRNGRVVRSTDPFK